jgi:hypothetical protein
MAFVGVDLGYRPTTNGRVEFIIQISPAMLQTLRPGDDIEVDADSAAQTARPSHFTITTSNAPLPHILPSAAMIPPGTAPIVPANPVLPAGATMSAGRYGAADSPTRYPPPQGSAAANPGGLFNGMNQPGAQPPVNSAEAKYGALPQVGTNSTPWQPGTGWWLTMSLFVIFLAASNGYVGWLFWDARQRYLGLVARTFATGQQPAGA